MFPAGSPYSPFFISGLLTRRGSIPDNSNHDQVNYRSFLSLDLAESNSMRSAVPSRKLTMSTPHLRVRFSRDSLRTIPSPKPVPSITLPDLPRKHSPPPSSPPNQPPPRLPSIPTIPSIRLSHKPATRKSPPAPVKIPQRHSIITTSSVSTRVRRANRSDALARLEGRSHSSSTSLPKQIQSNFMSMSDDENADADASDFSAHDSSDSDSDDSDWAYIPVMEPEDVVIPIHTPERSTMSCKARLKARAVATLNLGLSSTPSLRLTSPTSPFSSVVRFTDSASSSPAPSPPPHPRSRVSALSYNRSRKHKDKRSTSDWLPLKSFIDLHNEDEVASARWSWRNLIEVASVS